MHQYATDPARDRNRLPPARFSLHRPHACGKCKASGRACSSCASNRNGDVDDESLESCNIPLRSPGSQSRRPATAAPTCPTGTRVDAVTDLNDAGFQAGFMSGYGITARMRVLPDRIDWAGKEVVEVLSQTSSTCPAGLTNPGPCHGGSTFTIGAPSGRSRVGAQQPAVRNTFYDFHTSRSSIVSFLHDRGRNPANLDACEAVCRQSYLCDGQVIGTHEITRRFRKGRFAGRDVTIIDVTKTDRMQGPGDFPQRTLPEGESYAGVESAPPEAEVS
jgi:hypothetical protein